MENNLLIAKLTYQILGENRETIAAEVGISRRMLDDMIEDQNWSRLLPKRPDRHFNEELDDLEEGENEDTVIADRFQEDAEKRMRLFSIAKDLAITTKMASLELDLVKMANEFVTSLEVTSSDDLSKISTFYKNLSGSMHSSLQMGVDENGMPEVIIKNLAG